MTARLLGTGVRSPLGQSLSDVVDALHRGLRPAVRVTHDFPDQARSFVVCEVPRDLEDRFTHAERRRMDRLHVLGVSAALDACEAADVAMSGERVAVVAGVGLPSPETLETQHRLAFTEPRRVSPLAIPLTMLNGLAAEVARRLGATGPCQTLSTACSSGADAIGLAMMLLATGAADRVLAVGADAPLTPSVLHGFDRSSALTGRTDAPALASQPFGAERDGFVLAEGAAAVVLVRDEEATPAPHGRFVGYGASSDAHHLTAPHPTGRGALEAIDRALASAGLAADDVVSVNSHGTSTCLNDAIEAGVVAQRFGRVPVTATKAATGHMIGGSGLLEALVASRSAVTGAVPPVGDYPVDAALDVALVTGTGTTTTRPGPVVSSSFGFGGQNAVVVAAP